MRLWSLLLASSCSLSHCSLSFSPGKATPKRRIKPEDSVWLARVTGDSWVGTDAQWGEAEGCKNNFFKANQEVENEKGGVGSARRGRVNRWETALMDSDVLVMAENRKLAFARHNILLLIIILTAMESQFVQWQLSRETTPCCSIIRDKETFHWAWDTRDRHFEKIYAGWNNKLKGIRVIQMEETEDYTRVKVH